VSRFVTSGKLIFGIAEFFTRKQAVFSLLKTPRGDRCSSANILGVWGSYVAGQDLNIADVFYSIIHIKY
jgi:hypothetical protein